MLCNIVICLTNHESNCIFSKLRKHLPAYTNNYSKVYYTNTFHAILHPLTKKIIKGSFSCTER